jgi:hypothetical protein
VTSFDAELKSGGCSQHIDHIKPVKAVNVTLLLLLLLLGQLCNQGMLLLICHRQAAAAGSTSRLIKNNALLNTARSAHVCTRAPATVYNGEYCKSSLLLDNANAHTVC